MTKMSAHAVLDHVLKDILHAITPLHEDWVIRFQIIDDLRLVVESMENFRGEICSSFLSASYFVSFFIVVLHRYHFNLKEEDERWLIKYVIIHNNRTDLFIIYYVLLSSHSRIAR